MSIIYSYPKQSILNADDLLIGTSVEKINGKQKNVTKNFTIQQIADFINQGADLVDPVASDFQIAVFHQQGKKITGSIMSQDIYPNGTGITISGSLATTSSISTPGNLTATGVVSLGSDENLISLNSKTRLNGPILDTNGLLGGLNQILLSDSTGVLRWQNYEAGLTYEGTWDAANNTTNGDNNSPALVSGVGISGHFYIVNVAGSTNLNGNNSWNVGDWAVFLDEGGQPASWQKIDNTSVLTGDGTAGVFAKWTDATTLNDSLMSQLGTNVIINGGLKVKDTVEATTTNSNLKLKGNGTGGVEIMSADGVTDGKIQLNCSQNSHGVTLQSPPHASGATYTLVLPTSFGGAGDVLTSAGTNPSQLVWTTPTIGTVTNFTAVSTAIPGITTTVTNPTATPELTLNITGTPGAGLFLDGTGNWSSPGGGVTDITATAPLNASVATGSVTLSMPAYATATGGYVPSGGASGQYLDGFSGNWTSIPASGVTSVTGDTTTIAATTGSTPVISAITTGGVGSGLANLATGGQIQTAIDTALAGTLTFKGTFNAASGFVTSGINNGLQLYSGTSGVIAITQGDFYIADTAGSFYNTTAMNVGDEAIALFTVAAAPPGSAITDWSVVPAQSSGGTVTSVGLSTDVDALAVTNSPVTGSGVLTLNKNGGAAGQYIDGDTGAWTDLPASGVTSVSQGVPFTSTGVPLIISPTSGSVVVSSAVYNGGSNIGVVPDGGSSTTFLKGDGTWGSVGGASTITTNQTTTTNNTTTDFSLNATPSGGAKSFVDAFVDGVYQEISTYSVTGTTLTFGTPLPLGVTVETKTTSGAVSGAIVSSVDIGQSSTTGNVDLRIFPLEVTSGQTIPGNANSLYIFTSTTGSVATVNLPASPTSGDSIKISNLGGLANVLGANGNKIMGVAADMTINTPTAAFEIIWSGSNNGWIIIGNV